MVGRVVVCWAWWVDNRKNQSAIMERVQEGGNWGGWRAGGVERLCYVRVKLKGWTKFWAID
jgi:hypothetical protein